MKNLIAFTLLLALCGTAGAQERHIDFMKPLLGVDDKPLMNPPDMKNPSAKPEPVTLSDIAVTALESSIDQDRGLSPEEHFKLDALARKIYKNHDCVLTNPEVTQIEDRIGKFPWPSNAVVGAAWRILDPARAGSLK